MAKLTNNSSSTRSFSKIEEDVYEARIARFIFLGSQKQRPYQGKPKQDAVMAKIAIELIGETVTMTDDGEEKQVPAVVYWDINIPGGGVGRGKAFELIEAAGAGTETFGDTQDYKGLIGMPLNVEVGSYISKTTGNPVTCVNGVSKMNKKAREGLEDLSTDTLFFDCYEDDVASKEAWTKVGNFVRDKLKGASDSAHIPAVQQSWPEAIEEDGASSNSDEF